MMPEGKKDFSDQIPVTRCQQERPLLPVWGNTRLARGYLRNADTPRLFLW